MGLFCLTEFIYIVDYKGGSPLVHIRCTVYISVVQFTVYISGVQCTVYISVVQCTIITTYRAQNLRQGIVMKTSFKTRVLRMGLGSSVDINIFVYEIFFYLFPLYSPFLLNLLNQNLQNIKTPKRKLESFVQ